MSLWTRTCPSRWSKAAVVIFLLWTLYYTFTAPASRISSDGDSIETARHGDICRGVGWPPFTQKPGRPPRKVYDLMMVNTELDLLEIRMNSSWDVVDYFVLVEGRKTFTGLDKPLHLKANMATLAHYESKIVYHEIEEPSNFQAKTPWTREDLHRNSMLTQVFPRLEGKKAPTAGDVIVVSDVDEMPRTETLALLRACVFPRRLTLGSRFYYYSFQNLHRGDEWAHPQATYYAGRWTIKPNDLRVHDGFFLTRWWQTATLPNASWHCSSCFGTIDELLIKMKSFVHSGLNAEQFRDRDRIVDRVRRGKDLWDRPDEEFDRVENNTDVPRFLREHPERFPYLTNRDGASAGFSDYEKA
ncbi:glycosyltransferase family 17 protein [Podospora appendiculata]|uniref:Glycosyltransferase family 17 protein n=1 Tax=Podospora appendiculata TaxID=314037 RepID=A0AAE1CGS7_9PEZI|nr:glycosyltransferase family 17 protein [Podospora appendiculata]